MCSYCCVTIYYFVYSLLCYWVVYLLFCLVVCMFSVVCACFLLLVFIVLYVFCAVSVRCEEGEDSGQYSHYSQTRVNACLAQKEIGSNCNSFSLFGPQTAGSSSGHRRQTGRPGSGVSGPIACEEDAASRV